MNSAFVLTDGAEFSFDSKKSHKFSDTDEGVILEHDFKFTNTGDEPLIISKYKVACTCTKITYPKEPILPGHSGLIHLVFNTDGKYGFQHRKIYISTNASKKPIVISFKVTVVRHSEEP